MSLPLRGWPRKVFPNLKAIVQDLVEHRKVYGFKIGRTNHVSARTSAYGGQYEPGPSHLLPIYETSSVDNVLTVEEALIAAFMRHPKCLNEANHAGGNVSPEYVQYVYVALWERPSR